MTVSLVVLLFAQGVEGVVGATHLGWLEPRCCEARRIL